MKIKNKDSKWGDILMTAMFLGMYGTMASPYLTNFVNIPGVAAILVAGITALLMGKFAAKSKKLKEFTFPLSMIVGMLSASVVSVIL